MASSTQKNLLEIASSARDPSTFSSQQKGPFGCFALTEKGAGVLSGLQVETEISFSKENNCLIIQ